MNRKILFSVMIFLIVSAGISQLSAGTYLIWDPCGSPSAESLREVFQAENYGGIIVSDIQPYLSSLNEYKPVFVFASWWCEDFNQELLDQIEPHFISYLENDGSMYWEGENTADFDIFNFDIATCATEPFNQINGVSQAFETLSLATYTTYAEMIVGGDGTAFGATDLCRDKSVYQENPYRTIVSSFSICCLTDEGQNSRADFANVIMGWLGGTMAAPEINSALIPDKFAILQNYPNPFNAQTAIRYDLPKSGQVTITIYNLLGQPLETLFDGWHQAGQFGLNWNAQDFPTGVYFARIENGGQAGCVKMVLLK